MSKKYLIGEVGHVDLDNTDEIKSWPLLYRRMQAAGKQVTNNFFNALFREPGAKCNRLFKKALPASLREQLGRGKIAIHPLLLTIVNHGLRVRYVQGADITKKVKLPAVTWNNINTLGEAVRHGSTTVELDTDAPECYAGKAAAADKQVVDTVLAEFAKDESVKKAVDELADHIFGKAEATISAMPATKPAGACDRLNKPATFAERVDDGCCCSAEADAGSSAGRNEVLEVAAAAMQMAVDEFPLETVAYIDSLYTWAHSESVRVTLKSGTAGKLREKAENLERQVKFWENHEHAPKVLPFIVDELRKTYDALKAETSSLRVPGYNGLNE